MMETQKMYVILKTTKMNVKKCAWTTKLKISWFDLLIAVFIYVVLLPLKTWKPDMAAKT